MSRIHKYIDAGGAWTEDITAAIRIGQTTGGPGGVAGLTQTAELGDVGIGGLEIDDVASTVGHSADGIIGLQQWTVDEDAAPVGHRRLATFWVSDRRYRNSKVLPELGTNVAIDVDLADLNALFSFRKFAPTDPDRIRPNETCAQRLAAVLASDLAAGLIVDNGLVELPDKGMDKHTYDGASLGDVIGDIAIQAGGMNWFARYNEADDLVELGMYDPNTSTIDTAAGFKISNVAADVNSTSVFAPDGNEELTRSPRRTFSRIDVHWTDGTERVTRPSTEATYARRDGTAPSATIKSAAKARDVGNAFAWRSRNEEDIIRVTVPMRAAYVNLALEGQRIQVKFRQFRGYTSYTWCRILRRTPVPWEGSEAGYDVAYELVPQEPGPTAPIVQGLFEFYGIGGSGFPPYSHLPNPLTIGNKLLVMISVRTPGGTDPIYAPNTAPGLPRWGPGAWTEIPLDIGGFATTFVEMIAGDGGGHTISMFWKQIDSTEQDCVIGNDYEVVGVFEVDGSYDFSTATLARANNQGAATAFDCGTLGTLAVGELAFMIVHSVPGYPDVVAPPALGFDAAWHDHLYRGNFEYWGGVTHPVVWMGHAEGAGAVVDPVLTSGDARRYCGLAIKVGP